VVGLSLPFVACRSIATHEDEEQMVIIDLRSVRLCRISATYAKAIAAFTPAPARKHKVDEEALEALLKQARFTEEERRARGLPPGESAAAESTPLPATPAAEAPPPVRPDAADEAPPQRAPQSDRATDDPEFKPWQMN
jgi:hypothetical protein